MDRWKRLQMLALLGLACFALNSCCLLPKPPIKKAFSEPVSFAVGNGPNLIATGDFNEDGHLDLAVANAKDNSVSILIGDGSGNFESLPPFFVGEDPSTGYPRFLAVGDFNLDDHQDLATANAVIDNTLGGLVSILLGDGRGGFNRSASLPITESPPPLTPSSLAVGDVNRDGLQDLVTANGTQPAEIGRGDDTISVLLGLGGGSFGRPIQFPVGHGALFVAFGNFNKDGYPDLAVVNIWQIAILFGKGGGDFSLARRLSVGEYRHRGSPWTLAVGDFNEDSHQDLVATLPQGDAVAILLGEGMGNFGLASILAVGDAPNRIAIGDFNRDGHQDLAITNSMGNTVSILWGDGKGNFSSADDLPAGASPKGVVVGDFDEDGDLDIAVTNRNNRTVSILLNQLIP